MSDKGIFLKVDEQQILNTISEMCDESLPPDLRNNWEDIRTCLINTRHQLFTLRIVSEVER